MIARPRGTRRVGQQIVWGKNDYIFPADGAFPYKRYLPEVEFHLEIFDFSFPANRLSAKSQRRESRLESDLAGGCDDLARHAA
jgi:hypothetical protein